ncbi:MAG: anti-sigma factor RsbA family regulatory protein [Streptosporangiales bacterium]
MSEEPEEPGGYSHEAFPYRDRAEFLAGVLSFLDPAARAGQPALVLLPADQLDLVRREFPAGAATVEYADITEAGANPGRLIGVWRRFAASHPGAVDLRGVCEPVYPGRSAAELAECELYEALLNAAFDAATPLRLMCAYDAASLPADVIASARRTHPFVTDGKTRQASPAFQPLNLAEPYARPLPAGPEDAARLPFTRGELGRLRAFVATRARDAGLAERPATALVAAVNEIATNSLQHGGGRGELRVWAESGALLCEVSDQGHLTEPLAGRLPPAADQGAGLWLANQLTDLVQIYSGPDGTVVRLSQRR